MITDNTFSPGRFRHFLLFLGCIGAVTLGGCATPAEYKGMTPSDVYVSKKHNQTVTVSVAGGRETESTGKPQISDAAMLQALTEAIEKSQVFSQVLKGGKAEYGLNVTIFSIEQPSIGFTFTVKMEAGWTLTRLDTNTIIWQEALKSEGTVTMGQEFSAIVRLRLATEGAARNNIAEGLAKISRLDLDAAGGAATPIPIPIPKTTPPSKKVPTPRDDTVANRLRELQQLRKEGVITEDEYQQKKKQLLDKL